MQTDVQTDEPTTKAFQFITNYLEHMVFGAKNIVALAEIANVYVAKLLEYGHHEVCDSTKSMCPSVNDSFALLRIDHKYGLLQAFT